LRRFLLESKTVSRLSHDHIIKVYEVGEGEKKFIVMEYLKYSLRNLLQDRGGKLPKKEALKIAQKIAKALEYAHKKGVIHRDIKPENILFRRAGHPVLTDFGLVRSLASVSDLTTKHTILGTPYYMSPEQCRGEKVDGLSDIYSLGILLFTMISGYLPYDGKSWSELCRKHTSSSIPTLPPRARHCQPLIDLMMAKDKHRRINASQVCSMIDELLAGAEPDKDKNSNQDGILTRIVIGLVITFVIIVILIVIFRNL
jgi:serine/threonine protein kinase